MFKVTEDKIREFLAQSDENHSVLYPYFKDWIESKNLPNEELFGMVEFLFFEDDYFSYYLDMKEKGINRHKIIDVGCQHGFQSVIFQEFEYIGVDITKHYTMYDEGHAKYILGKDFTELDLDLSDSILISNMSLGYFNNWINKTDKEIAEKLSKCDYLYIATTGELIEELKPYYDVVEEIYDNEILGDHFRRMFFGRKS